MKVFILLSVVTLVVAGRIRQECGANQHYECGTTCPDTCDNYDEDGPCNLSCMTGCFCNLGYVRAANGECVRPSVCPKAVAAERARLNCFVPAESGPCFGDFPRFYFNKTTGQCLKFRYGGCGGNENNFETEEKCYKQCKCSTNETYSACGNTCQDACNKYDKSGPCLKCQSGCFCKEGYAEAADGQCVDQRDCPAKSSGMCGVNQYYSACGAFCEFNCELNTDKWKKCGSVCVPGCVCNYGLLRNDDNQCVRFSDCPPKSSKAVKVKQDRSFCVLPADPGPCLAHLPRFYFDRRTGQCLSFIYGGCRSNKNNFKTKEECYKQCGELVYQHINVLIAI